tara:strand:- start:3538 stop:4176 length:639 start_codon:yes stop_codon:yes gene_type:complete
MDVWRDVDNRIGFNTYATSKFIPEEPGIYGWFIPLWPPTNTESAQDYISRVGQYFLYDSTVKGPAEKKSDIKFSWEAFELNLRKKLNSETTEQLERRWDIMMSNEDLYNAFSAALMEASLLLPPLYIGKTNNLRERYFDHVKGSNQRNDFHERFSEFAKITKFPISVGNLLFVSIKTSREVKNVFLDKKDSGLNNLLEQVVMRLARPAFSEK